jgi:DNA-binding transcriptional ArsR family regulator
MTNLHSSLLRIASELPKGDATRREILSALKRASYYDEDYERDVAYDRKVESDLAQRAIRKHSKDLQRTADEVKEYLEAQGIRVQVKRDRWLPTAFLVLTLSDKVEWEMPPLPGWKHTRWTNAVKGKVFGDFRPKTVTLGIVGTSEMRQQAMDRYY